MPNELTQDDLNQLVSDYVFTSGAALRTVERLTFVALCLRSRPGLTVPSRSLMSGYLLDDDLDGELEDLVGLLTLQPYVAISVDGCTSVRHLKCVNFVLFGPNMKPKLWTTRETGADSQTGDSPGDTSSTDGGSSEDEDDEWCDQVNFEFEVSDSDG